MFGQSFDNVAGGVWKVWLWLPKPNDSIDFWTLGTDVEAITVSAWIGEYDAVKDMYF